MTGLPEPEFGPMRCPVCRAENRTGPGCRRCKADLSMLFALDRQRSAHLSMARAAILREDWANADYHTIEALTIRDDRFGHELRAVIALLRDDFQGAFTRYLAVKSSG